MQQQSVKFIVLKVDDVNQYLDDVQKSWLQSIIEEIAEGRIKDKKKVNKYVAVNMDEPYALVVSELINIGNVQKRLEKDKKKDEKNK